MRETRSKDRSNWSTHGKFSFLLAAWTTLWQTREGRLFSHWQWKLSMCMGMTNTKPVACCSLDLAPLWWSISLVYFVSDTHQLVGDFTQFRDTWQEKQAWRVVIMYASMHSWYNLVMHSYWVYAITALKGMLLGYTQMSCICVGIHCKNKLVALTIWLPGCRQREQTVVYERFIVLQADCMKQTRSSSGYLIAIVL